jgi:F-type H+-transporting ATPase subunit epsilon
MVSALGVGQVKVLKKGLASETYAIQGGFVEVINNQATVLVEGVL